MNVVRKRGQPNRRGGHGNRGSRGNSRGSSRGSRGGGSFSRKQDKYDFDDMPVASSAWSGHSSEKAHSSSTSRGRGSQPGKRRVQMQRLHMTTENQEMVRGMLQELHTEQESTSEDDIEELDWRAESQYWMSDNRLKIEDADTNTYQSEQDAERAQYHMFNQLAVNKLQRYGFHKSRCEAALSLHNGDIGQSLEFLLSRCFDLNWTPPSTTHDPDMALEKYTESDDEADTNEEASSPSPDRVDTDVDWDNIYEQRTEEKFALESIYEDRFKERVPNKVWVVNVDLPKLTSLARDKVAGDKARSFAAAQISRSRARNMCAFYLKGSCKFGDRCKYNHFVEHEVGKSEHAETTSEFEYQLEIRFPEGNTYPEECPFIAFQTTNILVPQHVCLNVTCKLMAEAKEQCESGLPMVFTLVSLLDDEEQIASAFYEPPVKFSLPEPIIKRSEAKRDLSSGEKGGFSDIQCVVNNLKQTDGVDESTSVSLGETAGASSGNAAGEKTNKDEMHRKYTRKEAGPRKTNPREIEETNLRLKSQFKRKKGQDDYKQMLERRKQLPAWQVAKEVVSLLQGNQVVVISGMTGCGKTTQIPQFILDHFLSVSGPQLCNIVCTQPRRISALAVAERVSQERVERVGGVVGYQIRLENVTSNRTRLLFCTTGILLRRLEADSKLQGTTHVIVDEVHERSEESDFLMMILRDVLTTRTDLRVILMSATLNADLFSQYFGGCPVLDIPGRTFPVDQYFLEDAIELTDFVIDENSPFARPLKRQNASVTFKSDAKQPHRVDVDEIEEAFRDVNSGQVKVAKDNIQDHNLTVAQLFLRYTDHQKKTIKTLSLMDTEKINQELIEALVDWIITGAHHYPRDGAILVFLPGYAEIQSMFEQLQTSPVTSGKNKHRFKIIPLHSTLSSEDQRSVFLKPKEGVTKIVLATNIAETSITIDDIVYVIDAGRMKEKRYDPSKGMESLDTVWVSRANALQRKGRAGRVAAGVCFHLFTSHKYDWHLKDQPIPEILRIPLEQTLLKVKILPLFKGQRVEDVLSRLIEIPAGESVESAVKRLQDLGALDEHKELTPLGFHVAALPVDVRIGKLMLFGAIFRCLDPALTIAATLSLRSPFVTPFGKKEEATTKKQELAIGNSDHLTMLKAYRGWTEAAKRGSYAAYAYCQNYFLSVKSLQMLASVKRQFAELLSDIGFIKEGVTSRHLERLARDGSDGVLQGSGQEANTNSENYRLVAAILVGALYPNVVQVLTPENKFTSSSAGAIPKAPKPEELKFKTKIDGYVSIHPSSVNFQVRYYDSPYLVFHEKVKTSKVFIRDCTMVSVYPLLLFGGLISIDLDRGTFIMSLDDGWIRFMVSSHQVAELVRELRLELDELLKDKIEKPSMDLCTCPRGSKIINTIVKLISTQ